MTAKEIWYVWDKKTIINGAKSCVFEGSVTVVGVGRIIHPSIPAIVNGLTHYTLGETRRRDWCKTCDGYGFVQKRPNAFEFVYEHKKCPDCRGRGYIWKLGENK